MRTSDYARREATINWKIDIAFDSSPENEKDTCSTLARENARRVSSSWSTHDYMEEVVLLSAEESRNHYRDVIILSLY